MTIMESTVCGVRTTFSNRISACTCGAVLNVYDILCVMIITGINYAEDITFIAAVPGNDKKRTC